MEKKSKQEQVKDKKVKQEKFAGAKFDPTKNYKWEPTDIFTLSGQEFGLILQTLRAFLSTESSQIVLRAAKANEIVDGLLARGVESGIVKEQLTPPQQIQQNQN